MFEFRIKSEDWYSRAGEFVTEHWIFQTPVFMPVWTKASVKWISKEDLEDMWAEIILNNTYHLYLRPWDEVVRDFWWVHKFQSYNKPILTDSWWFQVFSLGQTWINGYKNNESLIKITEDWVHFRSHIDGSKHFFTAEKIMDIENNLWADIIMAFDECAPGQSSKEYAKSAMERTHRWAIRWLHKWIENEKIREKKWLYKQAYFPIIQWVTYDELRIESSKFIWNLGTPWVAIWWLSVWESKKDMYRILDITKQYLPKNKPRYLMWVWTPEDLIEAIYRGVDMFDCVLHTRLWRHWTAFSSIGNIKIRNNKYKLSDESLDKNCDCKICKNYSKWYLRHLITENEIEWMSMLSYHNLYLLINLAKKARKSIIAWEFENFRKDFFSIYNLNN